MKLANEEEKACWMAAIQSAPEVVDDDGIPAPPEQQAEAAAHYADLVVDEYRTRL